MTFDHCVDDLERVFDAAEVERAAILGISQGCPLAIAFAALHPQRVSALIMIGGYAVLMPRSAIRPVDMNMEEAMRFTLTAGVTGATSPAARREPD